MMAGPVQLVKSDSVDYYREAEEDFQHSSLSQDGGRGRSDRDHGAAAAAAAAAAGGDGDHVVGGDGATAGADAGAGAGTRLEDLPPLTDSQTAEVSVRNNL